MVKMKDADGMVSGACHSTADTLRPCLQILKTKPGTKLVSAFFVIVVPDCDMGADGTFIFADSGLEQNPDPEKLAAIALSSADSFRLLTGKEPIVAMLSHSTKGSAKHPDVDKVVEATRIAKRTRRKAFSWMESSSLTRRSYQKWALQKHREVRWQAKRTYWYSQIWMREISVTSWLRDWRKQRLTVR